MNNTKNWEPTITVPYESLYKPKKLPLCIMDFRVYIWRLVTKYENFCEALLTPEITHNFIRAQFAVLYHNIIPELNSKYKLIICNDQKSPLHAYPENAGDKNYWRNTILFKENLPEYKGSRGGDKSKPEFYSLVYDIGISYAQELGIPVLEEEGFEADDFVGKLVREKSFSNDYIICSIDSDLMQLVNDDKGILWYSCNNFGHTSKLRTEVEVSEYCLKIFGKQVASPREIVDIKVEGGDSSDCLLPGSPRGVIDLLNPTYEPQLSTAPIVLKLLNDDEPNISLQILTKAQNYLTKFPVQS